MSSATPPTEPSTGRKSQHKKRFMLQLDAATEGLVTLPFSVPAREVVFVKGLLEASEGLGCLFAESGGELTLATTREQSESLLRFAEDVAAELELRDVPVLSERGAASYGQSTATNIEKAEGEGDALSSLNEQNHG